MEGIDLNQPVIYKHASMRYFEAGEHHVDRVCRDDVLLLVFDGILRFSEDGTEYAVGPGCYHIQRSGSLQKGVLASDLPRYLYVHFLGQWNCTGDILPPRGSFDYQHLRPLMEKLDTLSHGDYTKAEQAAVFMKLLSKLYRREKEDSLARQMGLYLEEHLREPMSLDQLSQEFHFSKNHIINLFRLEFGLTPTQHLNALRLQKARHLLEASSNPAEEIAAACGYNSYSHFYRLFMKENGISPTRWREQKRLAP